MNIKRSIGLILVLLFLVGCVTTPLTPVGKYYDALATFNDLVESYEWHYQIVDVEKQAVLKKYVDPAIENASVALDLWGESMDNAARMSVYNTLFKELQLIMIRYGVGGDV
jgi:hypothetical protein